MYNNPNYLPTLNTVKLSKLVIKPLFLLALLISACNSQPAQQPAAVVPELPVAGITEGTETTFQEYPASIEGTVNVEIRPQVNGTLEKVFVDEGAFVSSGQPIFKINDQPYRASLNNTLAAQHSAEATLINAQLEIERLMPLVQNKVISEFQLKSAKATAQVAKANIEQAKANVATARINLGYTLIKAPVSGYIGRLIKKQGSLVAATDVEALTQLSDVHDIHAYFSLGEKDFVNFKSKYPGQTLNEKLKHLPAVKLVLADNTVYERPGKIDVIDGQFDKTTGSITVRAKFPNPQGLLRSGNTGKIQLSFQHTNTLIVPQSATIEVQDKVFIFLLTDSNKVKKQAIAISGKSGINYLVKDGIKAGDQIVLSGLDRLQEGMVIKPQSATNKVAKN